VIGARSQEQPPKSEGSPKDELSEDHPDTLESKNDLAVLYKEQGRHNEGEPLLLEAVEGRRLKLGDKHPHTQQSLNNLIALYEAWGKAEKAAQWRGRMSGKDVGAGPDQGFSAPLAIDK
jgi:hypothetical protein